MQACHTTVYKCQTGFRVGGGGGGGDEIIPDLVINYLS